MNESTPQMRSVHELMRLDGRVALITGGAGHIGSTIADAFAELGADIAVLDRNAEGAQAVAAGLCRTRGVRAVALGIDLADPAATQAAPARVCAELGGLDILVNCAAFVGTTGLTGWACGFDRQSAETWRQAMEVNLTAVFELVQAAHEPLARRGGSIVNVSSIYGMAGQRPQLYAGTDYLTPAAYAASKGGLLQLTRYLATVLAPDIRVNAITPGGIWRNQSETFRQRYEGMTPLRRMGHEEDLKGAAVFLAGSLSDYVTGQNIVVDGGWTL